MKIGTWNVCGSKYKAHIESQRAEFGVGDCWVITEPTDQYVERWQPAVTSSPSAKGAPWVAIFGPKVRPATAPMIHGVGAIVELDGREVAVFGTVLPWNGILRQAQEFAIDGETTVDQVFQRIVDEQAKAVQALAMEGRPVVWAGDFNQPLIGPNSGFSNARRGMLKAALSELRLSAVNAHEPSIHEKCHAIDLICVDSRLTSTNVRVVEAKGRSDHHGYLAELGFDDV